MNKMILKCASILLLFGYVTLADVQAQVNAGGGLAYGTDIERLGLHLNGFYDLPNHEQIRAGIEFTYFLPEDFGGASFRFSELNINGHYRFYENENARAYGVGGLNYATYRVKYDQNIMGLTSSSVSKVGLNVGVGGEYGVNFGHLFGELKFVISQYDQLVLSVGARIPFDL